MVSGVSSDSLFQDSNQACLVSLILASNKVEEDHMLG